jgi:phosphoserine phosphatase RsbU/P
MDFSYPALQDRLASRGFWPRTRVARGAWYSLGLALFLFFLQQVSAVLKLSWGKNLGGWVSFLSFIAIFLFSILAFRWLKAKILWRLRNRLIVTYIFIGVVPALLLIAMAFATLYLFAGQFANFIVTSEIHLQLHSVESVNSAFGHELAARLERGDAPNVELLERLRKSEVIWKDRQVCAWLGTKPLPVCGNTNGALPFAFPSFIHGPFSEIVRDSGQLYLRAATVLPVRSEKLTVVSSEALDQALLQEIAANLGEVTLDAVGFELRGPSNPNAQNSAPEKAARDSSSASPGVVVRNSKTGVTVEGASEVPRTFTAGALPAAASMFDHQIAFRNPLAVIDWESGNHEQRVPLISVQTRPSVLYSRLFAALGDFAKGLELVLLAIAIVLAVIELLALAIGTSLTRSITGAVAQLYKATQHIDHGDFSHRIPVKSSDQLAELAHSFNTMTASIEKLIIEQKEKQRLENELVIAQEVQAQLFPREISQLESLEVHGFCRPARTVSGDYYDFLTVNTDRIILAAGDVSGKGISAALLMATIHSAVRAYSMVGMPLLREQVAVGGAVSSGVMMLASGVEGVEVSPGALLSLLNHQLYDSTPQEKYATLFLAIYDGRSRKLTYSNGGHLPPVIVGPDSSIHRLDQGGTVVGLFDNLSFDEASVLLKPGDIFIAYSDGITEPENDFGEFGEQRLIDLVRENRDRPLLEITERVTAAVDDWIGDNEQPDDITLVLARAR